MLSIILSVNYSFRENGTNKKTIRILGMIYFLVYLQIVLIIYMFFILVHIKNIVFSSVVVNKLLAHFTWKMFGKENLRVTYISNTTINSSISKNLSSLIYFFYVRYILKIYFDLFILLSIFLQFYTTLLLWFAYIETLHLNHFI